MILPFSAVAPVAQGHDMWIMPSDFRPAKGALVEVGLEVGHPASAFESVPRDPGRIVRFSLVDLAAPGEEAPILGVDGSRPAGLVRPEVGGLGAMVYLSDPAWIELAGEKFDRYLEEEGLEGALARRRSAGGSPGPGKERFSRSLKALVAIGGDRSSSSGATAGNDRPLGLPLELVAGANPYMAAASDLVRIRVLLRGDPLEGALVEAIDTGEGSSAGRVVALRSDAEGWVSFQMTTPGPWLVTAVHIEPLQGDPRADWESIWASLTFGRGVPGEGGSPVR